VDIPWSVECIHIWGDSRCILRNSVRSSRSFSLTLGGSNTPIPDVESLVYPWCRGSHSQVLAKSLEINVSFPLFISQKFPLETLTPVNEREALCVLVSAFIFEPNILKLWEMHLQYFEKFLMLKCFLKSLDSYKLEGLNLLITPSKLRRVSDVSIWRGIQ
jgi:hypothetical protein